MEEGSYEAFVDSVYDAFDHPSNTQRLGQLFFNKLLKVRPDVAEQIRATMFDPFHRHVIHEKVSDRVRTLWYGEQE